MTYTKQTWTDGVSVANADRFNHMETGIKAAHTLASSTSAVPRLGILRVASMHAPADVKAQCQYVCTGVNDQIQINDALQAATRPGDGFGGTGAGCVELVGGDFYIASDNATSINMYPSTWLRGSGPGVFLRPRWTSTSIDRGTIELVNQSVAHVRVSDLTIGRESDIATNGHGIKFYQSGKASAYQMNTGSDPFIWIHDVMILKVRGKGVYLTGAAGSGGCRATQVLDVVAWNTSGDGFDIQSSDCHLTNCNAQPNAGGNGFRIQGGNSKLLNCKSYYSEADTDGFLITSSRAEVHGCAAQDNGRWGFNISSGDCTVTGCVADSNARMTSSGGGFNIASTGVYEGLHAFDRGQTPSSPQLRGIVLAGSPQVMLTGRSSVPSGSAHVIGAPGAGSYAKVVRSGTSVYSVG
jgi:hypothetical protein